MKKIILYLALSFFLYSTAIKAQDNNDKLESFVNKEFGTLLETLLKDGKIDEINAKSYLETVFGYDDTVNSFLQSANLSTKISGLKQGKMSTDSFLSTLNSTLISFIPVAQQQAYMNRIQAEIMVQGSLNELISGHIGENSINLAAGILESIKDNKVVRLKNDAISKKLEIITPTLSKLNESNKTYKKLKIIDECSSSENWIINTNPIVKEDNSLKKTTNQSVIENGMLKINTQNYIQAIFNWDKPMFFEPLRYYKNNEKFDFSKDFAMNIYFKMEKRTNQSIILEIGKAYKLYINRSQGNFSLITPFKYVITEKFGELRDDNRNVKREIVFNDKHRGIINYKIKNMGNLLIVPEKKNSDIDFDGILKVTITKKGNTFSYKFNDLPHEVTTEVNYFPNKYYLGFLVNAQNKKAYIAIDKLELEHL